MTVSRANWTLRELHASAERHLKTAMKKERPASTRPC